MLIVKRKIRRHFQSFCYSIISIIRFNRGSKVGHQIHARKLRDLLLKEHTATSHLQTITFARRYLDWHGSKCFPLHRLTCRKNRSGRRFALLSAYLNIQVIFSGAIGSHTYCLSQLHASASVSHQLASRWRHLRWAESVRPIWFLSISGERWGGRRGCGGRTVIFCTQTVWFNATITNHTFSCFLKMWKNLEGVENMSR